jgi:hypothetical protein
MTTRHVSLRLTLYPDGDWATTLLLTTCDVGRPARMESLVTRKTDLYGVWPDLERAVQSLIDYETARVELAPGA